MRTSNRFVIGTAALLCQIALTLAQTTTVTTDPVGFNTVAVSANTVRALSLPFNEVPKYAAAVSSVTSTTIKTDSAGWTASPDAGNASFGPFASNPNVIRIVSGAAVGRQFRIASNTADTLTLLPGSDLTGVAAGDKYQIFASATLASLFGPTGTGLNTSTTDPAQADNVLIRGTSTWSTYYNNGTQWLRQGTDAPSNTAAITPEQGFLLVRRGNGTYNFTSLGAVPITNLKTDLPANKVTALGNEFPVATSLIGAGGLNLDTIPGWNKSSDPNTADNVLVRGSSWTTYYYDPALGGPTNNNPGSWVRQGTQTPDSNPLIPIGASVVVVRRGGTNVVLNQTLPYTP